MYAVDDIGTLWMVRLDALWLASLVTRPEVVVCADVSREKLLLALLAAPLLQTYLTTVTFEG